MRNLCLAACLVLLLAAGAHAEEDACRERVAEAVAPHKADFRGALKKIAKVQEDLATCQTEAQSAKSLLEEKLTTLKARLVELESKLLEASKASKPDLPTIAVALVGIAKDSAVGAYQESVAIVKELQQGKTDRLVGVVGSTVKVVTTSTGAAYAFVAKEADEHLPPWVKEKVAETTGKVQAAWKQYVADASWAQPVLAQVSKIDVEVKKIVTQAVTSRPALAPLADPVTIQLLVYAVFAVPVLLLLVLPLALAGGKKAPAAAAPAGARSKAKKGPKTRA